MKLLVILVRDVTTKKTNKILVLQVLIFIPIFRSSFSVPISLLFLSLHLLSDGFFVFSLTHPLPDVVKESLTASKLIFS